MLTISLDFDGVMYPLLPALAPWWTSSGRPESIPLHPTTWHFWRELGVSDPEFAAALEDFGEDGGYRRCDPYPGVLEGLEAMFDAGADLLGSSSRPPTRMVEASTYGWTADFQLPLRAIHLGGIHAKLEVECDVHVDDDPVALDEIEKQGEACGILLDQSWNRDCDRFPRVSWGSLPPLVELLQQVTAGEPDSDRHWAIEEALADTV